MDPWSNNGPTIPTVYCEYHRSMIYWGCHGDMRIRTSWSPMRSGLVLPHYLLAKEEGNECPDPVVSSVDDLHHNNFMSWDHRSWPVFRGTVFLVSNIRTHKEYKDRYNRL